MPRSLKKSPFVAYHLLKKINKLNKLVKKIPLQHGLVHQLFYQVW
jgi:ribosomal protein S19